MALIKLLNFWGDLCKVFLNDRDRIGQILDFLPDILSNVVIIIETNPNSLGYYTLQDFFLVTNITEGIAHDLDCSDVESPQGNGYLNGSRTLLFVLKLGFLGKVENTRESAGAYLFGQSLELRQICPDSVSSLLLISPEIWFGSSLAPSFQNFLSGSVPTILQDFKASGVLFLLLLKMSSDES